MHHKHISTNRLTPFFLRGLDTLITHQTLSDFLHDVDATPAAIPSSLTLLSTTKGRANAMAFASLALTQHDLASARLHARQLMDWMDAATATSAPLSQPYADALALKWSLRAQERDPEHYQDFFPDLYQCLGRGTLLEMAALGMGLQMDGVRLFNGYEYHFMTAIEQRYLDMTTPHEGFSAQPALMQRYEWPQHPALLLVDRWSRALPGVESMRDLTDIHQWLMQAHQMIPGDPFLLHSFALSFFTMGNTLLEHDPAAARTYLNKALMLYDRVLTFTASVPEDAQAAGLRSRLELDRCQVQERLDTLPF